MTLSELAQAALLGTERQAPDLSSKVLSIQKLISQLDPSKREAALLSAAAVAVQYERAGALAAKAAEPASPVCPAETQNRVTDGAAALLKRLLDGEHPDLFSEWLDLAAQGEWIAPPETLPALLSAGVSHPEMAEAIMPVLGERGRWLAAQNAQWEWALGRQAVGADDWHTGNKLARLRCLRYLRQSDPDAARELLVSTWKEETPEDRAEFLGELKTGLSLRDEPFLETALDDKRKEVRRTAVLLLARTPGSALAGRMIDRAKALLRFTPAETGKILRLKKAKAAVLEMELPGECDKAMQRDGIEVKPPGGLGEKAWWLIQILELTPLETWTDAWNAPIAAIVASSAASEWKNELGEAWMRAAVFQRNPDWAEAVLPRMGDLSARTLPRAKALIEVLPPARREQAIESYNINDISEAAISLSWPLLAECRHSWSGSFSRSALGALRLLVRSTDMNWQIRQLISGFARWLAPETLSDAITNWPVDTPAWELWSSCLDPFFAAAQFRADMRSALKK